MTETAIIGTGRMGSALGLRLAKLGHRIVFGSRNPDRNDLRELIERCGHGASAAPVADAVRSAEQVIVAVPFKAMDSVLAEVGDLDGQRVIDVSNALEMDKDGLMRMAVADSSGERLQAAKPGAQVVKAFNTIGFHVIANPVAAGGPVTVPIAGNDSAAKQQVIALGESLGFECLDLGPLRQAHALEAMAQLYLVPYLSGRREEAFEFYLRQGASPASSGGVRAAE